MRRSEATRRLEQLLANAAGGGRYSARIREIWVFGSYARGAGEVGDIDLGDHALDQLPPDRPSPCQRVDQLCRLARLVFGQRPDRVRRLHQQPGHGLDAATGAKPADGSRRPRPTGRGF
jgi:hypothetical protein